MYAEYAKEADEDNLYYDQVERTSDIQLPSVVNILLLGGWLVICLVGFAIIFWAKMLFIGIAIIAIPTFIGMVIKPTFSLCVMMLALPTGAGVGYVEIFSLDHGVGIAVAVAFALNLLLSRPRLRIGNKALWIRAAYTIWVFFAAMAAPYMRRELGMAFTQLQLLMLVFIVYWILETNHETTFRWALRSYIIGTLGMIALAFITGTAVITVEETGGMYAATVGRAIDANMLACITAMAFLAAIYLFARDRNILWRIVYLIAILFLPLMLLRIASRGALIALAFTLLSPLLFLRQTLRKPALTALLLVVVLIASVSTMLLVKKKGLETEVAHRLTDIQLAKDAIDYRLDLVWRAVKCAIKYPAGTSYYGWVGRSGETHHPHGDLFFSLGIYGIPAMLLFLLFVITLMFTVKRIPIGPEKLYARAVLTFLLVMGLDIGQLYQKHFWVFLVIVMAAEHINRPSSDVSECIDGEIDEETADINY